MTTLKFLDPRAAVNPKDRLPAALIEIDAAVKAKVEMLLALR
jgi:hypothetical protein